MRLLNRTSACALAALALLAGCPDRNVSTVDPAQDKVEVKEVPVNINRKVDILFVIDNSGSMREEQDNLRRNFPEFIRVLETIEGGVPDVHIGVISTDVGAGNFNDTSCPLNGDNGQLQVRSACEDLLTDGANYIKAGGDDPNVTNLEQAFNCMAELGTGGCGFEQPLESMRRALEPGANGDFIREDAFLAVILLTDEDDCSAANEDIFTPTQDDEPGDPVFDELGYRSSYRCFEFGVTCEGGNNRDFGPREDCESNEESEFFYPVDEYVQFLKDLKGTGTEDDSRVIVAGIYGLDVDSLLPEPVRVGPADDNPDEPELQPVCDIEIAGGTGFAFPGVRVKRFIDAFPDRNTSTTICDNELEDALVLIAELLKKAIGNPCIEGNLVDLNEADGIQADCSVSYVTNPGQDNQTEQIVPPCPLNDANPAGPCWRIDTDAVQCPEAPHYKLDVVPPSGSLPDNTVERAQCVVEDPTVEEGE